VAARFEFRLLGSLEVVRDGTPVPVGSPKLRVLLAALLVDANQVVPMDVLVSRLWGEAASDTARNTVQNYVQRLRQALGAPEVIVTRPNGYLVDVADGALDSTVFEALARDGKSLLDKGKVDEAGRALRSALELWHGDALTGIQSEVLQRDFVPALAEQRLAALENRVEADIQRGLHRELVGELLALTGQHPLRERLWGQLMLVLYRSDQQAEALHAYQRIRAVLAEELGLDPSARLRQLHQRILGADPALTATARAEPSTNRVPRQLPAHTPHFVGRGPEMDRLSALADGLTTVVISAIDGTAGIGKTALAVHWAHRAASRFPDGQLYVNLRGFDPNREPMAPSEALRGFLGAFDVPAERVPAAPDAQAALFRSLLAGRKVLVLLDNARDADQVRPLLPGASTCHVVITSRNRLPSLVAWEGAVPLSLDTLGTEEARALLTGHIGDGRTAAEPDAVDDLITRCARLPLALAIVAARARFNPQFPLRAFADELADQRTLLDALDIGDELTSVRGVFWWSYRHLGERAARMFRLLGVHPGPDISWHAAASLAGVSRADARAVLGELTAAHLLTEHRPGRYAFHDLLRAYAAEQVDEAECGPALLRVFDHYTRTAVTASMVLHPLRDGIVLPPPVPGADPEQPTEHAEGWAWFETEEPVLDAVVALARERGFNQYAWQLPWASALYVSRLGRWEDFRQQQRAALAAAEDLGDLEAQGRIHHMVGHANVQLRQFDEAGHHLRQAMELYRRLGDVPGEARAHRGLGLMYELLSDDEQALVHVRAALALFQEVGHLAGQASALNGVGFYLDRLGRPEDALTHCEQALALHQEMGDRPGAASTLDSLGTVHHHLADYPRAIDAFRRSIALLDDLGDRYEQAASLDRLGDTHLAAGDQASARHSWELALDLFEQLGNPGADELRRKLGRCERAGSEPTAT